MVKQRPQGKVYNAETMVLHLSRCAALSPGSDFPPWLLGYLLTAQIACSAHLFSCGPLISS